MDLSQLRIGLIGSDLIRVNLAMSSLFARETSVGVPSLNIICELCYLEESSELNPAVSKSSGGHFLHRKRFRWLEEFGVNLSEHYSKDLECCDLGKANLIVPMEYWQYVRLIAIFPEYKGKIKLLRDFHLWPARLFCNIYDPFGLGEEGYRRCFLGMQKAVDGLKKNMMIVEKS